MEIIVKRVTNWERVVNAARMTVHLGELGKDPADKFKAESLMSAHSPKYTLEFDIVFKDIPYFVAMHLVRHNVGVIPFVATSREDRTGVPRNERRQTDLVDMMLSVNAQSIINISLLRLCSCADPETRKVWREVVNKIGEIEPMLAHCCVPQCVYRGRCPEPVKSRCGYDLTEAHHKAVDKYWSMIGR